MDRISALRNVEDALSAFERGEATLEETERQVVAVCRSYATDYTEGEHSTYRVEGVDDEVLVVAEGPTAARERAESFGVDPVDVDRP